MKYYVVWKGKTPGVYDSWAACKLQIEGFHGALYKSFPNQEQAEQAFKQSAHLHLGTNNKNTATLAPKIFNTGFVLPSISVDAACNPRGVFEYQGVWTENRERIFHQGPFPDGSNNIGEFLALVHALALCKKRNWHFPIYTDSVTALAWLRNKKAKTSVSDEKTLLLVQRAEIWLSQNTYPNVVQKWQTDQWGEIYADFGRK